MITIPTWPLSFSVPFRFFVGKPLATRFMSPCGRSRPRCGLSEGTGKDVPGDHPWHGTSLGMCRAAEVWGGLLGITMSIAPVQHMHVQDLWPMMWEVSCETTCCAGYPNRLDRGSGVRVSCTVLVLQQGEGSRGPGDKADATSRQPLPAEVPG